MIDALAERVEREEARLAFVKAASEAADGIDRGDPVFEMLVMSYGRTGYVALYRVHHGRVEVLALRPQREAGYADA
jgi:hypothetical protein